MPVQAQKPFEPRRIGFSRLSKQPADRFLHEVVIFAGQRTRGGIRLVEILTPPRQADETYGGCAADVKVWRPAPFAQDDAKLRVRHEER